MNNAATSLEGLLTGREVPPTFGAKQVSADPVWEREFSSWLKETTSLSRLEEIFAAHRSGEDSLSLLMRRVLMHSMCRAAGESLLVGPDVVLKHPETMEFGNYIFIGAQAMIQGRFDGTCRIGNHVWIGPQAYLDARDLVLEDYVGWGPGAKVLGSTHSGQPRDVPIITTNLIIKPVVIGYGADVGMNASILPGVRIGQHAIVGAGAVVTRDVPDYAVVAGVPARVLYSRGDV
jgi:acetyltransferase-like isoleucine patch superfamily enzyme